MPLNHVIIIHHEEDLAPFLGLGRLLEDPRLLEHFEVQKLPPAADLLVLKASKEVADWSPPDLEGAMGCEKHTRKSTWKLKNLLGRWRSPVESTHFPTSLAAYRSWKSMFSSRRTGERNSRAVRID